MQLRKNMLCKLRVSHYITHFILSYWPFLLVFVDVGFPWKYLRSYFKVTHIYIKLILCHRFSKSIILIFSIPVLFWINLPITYSLPVHPGWKIINERFLSFHLFSSLKKLQIRIKNISYCHYTYTYCWPKQFKYSSNTNKCTQFKPTFVCGWLHVKRSVSRTNMWLFHPLMS